MGQHNKPLSEIEALLLGDQNYQGNCLLLILSWLAGADGHIHRGEQQELIEVSRNENIEHTKAIIELGRSKNLYAIQLASEFLRGIYSHQQALRLIELAVKMASADGIISQEEVRIVKYLCDVVGISSQELETISRETIRRPFPQSYDLSQASFWARQRDRRSGKRQQKEQEQGSHSGQQKGKSQGHGAHSASNRHTQAEVLAFGLLGLEPGASPEDIKMSYRRMAKVHHPDRFSSLGEEAVAAATQHFQKIQSAYELLSTGGRA